MVSNEIIMCPFCGKSYPFSTEFKFSSMGVKKNIGNGNRYYFDLTEEFDITCNAHTRSTTYEITITSCPYCSEDRLEIKKGVIDANCFLEWPDHYLNTQLRPKSIHKTFPNYVPKAICDDYEEACSILKLSPKAAATLARRALEGMILDFWEIPSKSKGNLKKEIDELQDKIPASQWNAIDALRNLGNIGAHMENDVNVIVDIDPGEAEKLINLIELLIEDWYISRHKQELLYNDIIGIEKSKQEERKNAGNIPAQN